MDRREPRRPGELPADALRAGRHAGRVRGQGAALPHGLDQDGLLGPGEEPDLAAAAGGAVDLDVLRVRGVAGAVVGADVLGCRTLALGDGLVVPLADDRACRRAADVRGPDRVLEAAVDSSAIR